MITAANFGQPVAKLSRIYQIINFCELLNNKLLTLYTKNILSGQDFFVILQRQFDGIATCRAF